MPDLFFVPVSRFYTCDSFDPKPHNSPNIHASAHKCAAAATHTKAPETCNVDLLARADLSSLNSTVKRLYIRVRTTKLNANDGRKIDKTRRGTLTTRLALLLLDAPPVPPPASPPLVVSGSAEKSSKLAAIDLQPHPPHRCAGRWMQPRRAH